MKIKGTPDLSWLPAFERELAWTIMDPSPTAMLSNAACYKLWRKAHRAGADGRVDEAALIFRRLLAQRPTDSEYALGLGRSLRELGETDEALQALEWAERLNPADQLTQHEIGAVFAATSRWAEAAEQFRKVLSMPPDGRTDIQEYARHSLGVCNAKLQSLPGEE
jgi:Flp pilus assembly protein TadD